MSQVDDIPAQWQNDQALSRKDGLAILSFLIFLIASLGLACFLVGNGIGLAANVPMRAQLHGSREWFFLGMIILSSVVAALAGKYLWLIAMCRILNKANVGPLVAYGVPRRISRFDQAFITRFYKEQAAEGFATVNTPVSKMIRSTVRGIAVANLSGALLAAALSFLPLMRGNSHLPQLAILFAVIGLLCFGLEAYKRVKKL